MNVLIYSDPHLGLVRKANFTPSSSSARESSYSTQLQALLNGHTGPILCLGDFFDKESNPEDVIISAMPLAEKTDLILAGNHDVSNRLWKSSSLQLLSEVYPDKVLIDTDEKEEGFTTLIGRTLFCFAPHVLTQEGYENTIAKLTEEASQSATYRVLCLHCNYDLPERFLSDSTLNLSRDLAYQLLSTFHHILIGHVHTARDDMDGRVKIVGSTFPTAFDNMDSKRVLLYDADTGQFEERTTWDPADHLMVSPASELSTSAKQVEYYDMENDMPPGEAQKLVLELFKKGALGVRLRQPHEDLPERPEVSEEQIEKLPAIIEAELAADHRHLLPLWRELINDPLTTPEQFS